MNGSDNTADYISDNSTIMGCLDKVFSSKKNDLKGFKIISREPAARQGTFEAEIVKCSFTNSPDITVRCKYLNGYENNQQGGHRGAVTYEAQVYEELLDKVKLPLAHFYGKFQIAESNTFCMVLEYLTGSLRITQVPDKSVLLKATEWIGIFHSIHENKTFPYIKKYDEAYYDYWNRNARNIAQELTHDYSWLLEVCHYFEANKHVLLTSPQTLIHGEYYPNNVLYKDGSIYPVDWESAALTIGEIDLASLTEGWDEDFASQMIARYVQARWKSLEIKQYEEFCRRLSLAKLYWQIRWIGRYPKLEMWKNNPKIFNNFYKWLEKLHKLSTDMSIL